MFPPHLQHLFADTGCILKDLLVVMNDRDERRERERESGKSMLEVFFYYTLFLQFSFHFVDHKQWVIFIFHNPLTYILRFVRVCLDLNVVKFTHFYLKVGLFLLFHLYE